MEKQNNELDGYQASVGKFLWDKETGMDVRFVFDSNPGDLGLYYKDIVAWWYPGIWAYAVPVNGEREASWDNCQAYEGIELAEMFKGYDMDKVYDDLRGQYPEDLLKEYKRGEK